LRQKLTAIILFTAFVAILLQPMMPFVQYYISQNQQNITQNNNCDCQCEQNNEVAPMENNGSNYLKALIKRACEDQKKSKKPAIPVLQVSVYILNLTNDYPKVFTCPKENFNKISTFIIQPDLQSYITDIFHPPASV